MRHSVRQIGFCLATGAAAFAMSLAATDASLAQTMIGDPDSGHELAREVCEQCHVIERGSVGAHAKNAPEFWAVADDPAMTALALRVFLQTPHKNMPDFILSEQETDDIIAYILSLR